MLFFRLSLLILKNREKQLKNACLGLVFEGESVEKFNHDKGLQRIGLSTPLVEG
jgi:hypothetical protein